MPPKRRSKRGNVTQPPAPSPKHHPYCRRNASTSRSTSSNTTTHVSLEATVSGTPLAIPTAAPAITTFVPIATSQHLAISSETPVTTSAGTAQLSTPQTQQLISQLSNMVQLLISSLTGGNALLNTPQPQMQVTMPDAANAHSTEVLSKVSEVSDNPPINVPLLINDNPHIRTTNNMHTGFSEPLVSATQNLPVSLLAVPSRLRDKIISGEFIDFTSLLPKAMFSSSLY